MTETGTGQGSGDSSSSVYAAAKEERAALSAVGEKPSPSSTDVRQRISEDVQSVKQAAQDQVSSVKEKAKDVVDDQKNVIAKQLSGIAAAVKKVGNELQSGDQREFGRIARNVGSSMQRFADDIQDRNLNEVVGMAEDFGRKQPFAFLGMAAIAGLAASRFLTASASRGEDAVSNKTLSGAAFGKGGQLSPSVASASKQQNSEEKFNG